jgi:hypothetical protein
VGTSVVFVGDMEGLNVETVGDLVGCADGLRVVGVLVG